MHNFRFSFILFLILLLHCFGSSDLHIPSLIAHVGRFIAESCVLSRIASPQLFIRNLILSLHIAHVIICSVITHFLVHSVSAADNYGNI